MSKNSLRSFEYKLKQENLFVQDVKRDMKYMGNSIREIMTDKVGESASRSIDRINDVYTADADSAIDKFNRTARALDNGYHKSETLLQQANQHVALANNLIKELGDL